jgi:hypothetical protein
MTPFISWYLLTIPEKKKKKKERERERHKLPRKLLA